MADAKSVFAAMRHVHESGDVSLESLAAIAGRSPRIVQMRADLEGWRRIAPDVPADRRKRIDTQYDRLIAELERLTLSCEGGAGLRFDKARADAVMAMVKALEKIGETMRTAEDAKDKQITDDAELAAVLQRIDDRIRSLARHHAGEVGAAPSECA